jgi:predicted Zn-ribbon and HTH transcriptional regulator
MKTVKDLCKEYGYSQTALAKRFGIPLRTVQNWHGGQREPAPYVVPMMEEILKGERPEGAERERSEWEFVREPNTVDTLGRPVYHAQCKKCGFVWCDLYAVKNCFKNCPGCGADMRKEDEGCHT